MRNLKAVPVLTHCCCVRSTGAKSTAVLRVLVAGVTMATCAHADLPSFNDPADARYNPWHLTARPWEPLDTPRTDILGKVEDIVNALAPLQYWNTADPGDVQDGGDVQNGAIIDAFELKEWQYGTPYFSFAVATVVQAGQSTHLLEAGARALDHSTADIAGLDGSTAANDRHGEFFGAPMTKALRIYKQMAATYPTILTPARIARWESRMTVSRADYMNNNGNNWRTYGMKGEWLRVQDGLVPRDSDSNQGIPWIESSWLTQSQRARFVRDRDEFGLNPYFLIYHDNDSGDRQNFSYLAGATGNLLDMIYNGYDGPSAQDMEEILRFGADSCLLQMAGNGESPAGGRTGNHIWNDIVYGNLFEMAAELAWAEGDERLAGQHRRAARLAFESAWRFQTEEGWFSVTKSLIHPSHQNRYASWSALVNYNGYTEIHSSEAYATRISNIPEVPAPSEVGGYAINLDPTFDSSFANAGGMQVQICTEGSGSGTSTGSQRWFVQGIQRFSRPGWDSRLGPGDGWIDNAGTQAISFAPAFYESGVWKLVAEQPDRFTGTFTPTFTHPLIVRGTLSMVPRSGQTGPSFDLDLTITPDGVLIDTVRTSGSNEFGIIWPLLEYDGKHILKTETTSHMAATAFPKQSAAKTTLEAENASLSGGVAVGSAVPDYSGSGYAVFPSSGGAIEWSGVEGGDGGAATVGFRYTLNQNTASSRTITLRVNGVAQSVKLEHTGKPNSYGGSVLSFPMVWQQIHVPATLLTGMSNVIRLEAGTAGGLNIDEMRVFPADASQDEPDQQNFICLDASPTLDTTVAPRRTGYGDQRPIRITNSDQPVTTFVYPRSGDDPTAESVRTSFVRNGSNDFSSVLSRVEGNLYVGRTSAGGVGNAIDLDNDGFNDATFSKSCGFVFQLTAGTVTHVEVDDFVTMTMGGRSVGLAPYVPIAWSNTGPLWNNVAVDAAAKRFEVSVDFTPESASIAEITGFCAEGTSDTNGLVAALSFNAEGMVVPLEGQASSALPYVEGVAHTIRALFDLEKGRYSVWVTPSGETEHRLISNAPVPEGVSTVADLDTFAYWADFSAASGSAVVEYPLPGSYGDLKINFQAASSSGYAGYFADTGAVFGDRGNGYSYGWIDGDNSSLARDRNSGLSQDERYDTLNHLNYNNPPTESHTWELEVENGTYTVRLVCGDPSYTDSFFHVLAEGVTLAQGDAESTGIHWFEGTTEIAVNDGRLTLSNGPGAYRNKICFVDISGGPPGEDMFPYQYYGDWAATHFPNAETNPDAAPTADFDQDGLINAEEYGQGTDPKVAQAFQTREFAVVDNTTTARLRMLWLPTSLDTGIRIWESDNLLDWSLAWSWDEDRGFLAPVVSSTGPDGWITFDFPITPDSEQRFYKCEILLQQ